MNKDVEQLIRKIEEFPGAEVDRTPNHPRVFVNGRFVTSLPSTPSKPSWFSNAKAALKRGGIDLDNPPKAERAHTPLAPLPTAITRTPETQFPVPAAATPGDPGDANRRSRGILTKAEASRLREKLIAFLKSEYGYPKRGTMRKYVRGLYLNSKGAERSFKTMNSCEVMVSGFINGQKGVSAWVASLIEQHMKDVKAGAASKEVPAIPRERPVKGRVKPIQAVRPEPVKPAIEKPIVVRPTPYNGVFDRFLGMVENRALTRAQLEEALGLAELFEEFEHSHPRS